jgi:Glycosyl transferases group 1
MDRRYLFVCSDRISASGGAAVIYDMVHILNQIGYDAAVLHNSPNGGYPDYPNPVPVFYTRKIWSVNWRYARPIMKFRMIRDRLVAKDKTLPLVELRPTDVIVAPEFLFAEAIEAFEGQQIAVFIQNPFGLMMAYHRSIERGLSPQMAVSYWMGIAEVCRSHMSMLGLEPSAIFPVSMKPNEFPYQEDKQRLITYMPRKRPWEAALISEALRKRQMISDYRIEALHNIPRLQVAERLAESRIFISLLHQEALGFPAAEAMSAGCIVVGFDGLGTAEYFDQSTGVPITEGDVAGIVEAVEQIVAEYELQPHRLDEMRRKASELVNDRYSFEAFRNGVERVWKDLDGVLSR